MVRALPGPVARLPRRLPCGRGRQSHYRHRAHTGRPGHSAETCAIRDEIQVRVTGWPRSFACPSSASSRHGSCWHWRSAILAAPRLFTLASAPTGPAGARSVNGGAGLEQRVSLRARLVLVVDLHLRAGHHDLLLHALALGLRTRLAARLAGNGAHAVLGLALARLPADLLLRLAIPLALRCLGQLVFRHHPDPNLVG